MNKSKILKKKKDSTDFVSDIVFAFNTISKRDKLYMITIEGITTSSSKDLNFQITNRFFNTIHRNIKNSFEIINYLFVIEYGGLISKEKQFETFIDNLGIHAHCIVETSLTRKDLEYYLSTCFSRIPNYKIQNISMSNTKDDLLNYLLKQTKNNILTKDCYNYKIDNK